MLLRRGDSITKKLARMNLLVCGAALLLACAGFFTYDLFTLRADIVRSLDVQTQIIGSNSISALVFDDPHAAEMTLSALKAAPHLVSAGIRKQDGAVFAVYRRDSAALPFAYEPIPPGQSQIHGFRDGRVFLVRKLVFNGQNIGTISILSDLEEMKDRELKFTIIVAVVLLVSLGTAMWISSFARRSIAQPIAELSDTARAISRDKNYSIRANIAGGHDEILSLVTTFNEMLDQIQARDAALVETHAALEQRVQERTAQLRAANTELEAFSYSVSHDLRAPLRHVSGFSGMLQEEYGPLMDPGAQRYLQKIQDGANRMGELIEDLLRMAQVGRKELVLAPTDLNLLLQNVLADLQSECAERLVEWQIGKLPITECDAGLLKQVFINLLSNALKYSRRRELAIIEIGSFEEKGSLVLFVRDNGAGFDPRYADKLFGVFQRLHRPDEFEGTGVGLATVKRIIQKHGGTLWAKSELEKGATFFFSLPKGASTMPPPVQKSGAAHAATTAN